MAEVKSINSHPIAASSRLVSIDNYDGETNEDRLFAALDDVDSGTILCGDVEITKVYHATSKDYRGITIQGATFDMGIDEWFDQSGATNDSAPRFDSCAFKGNGYTIFSGSSNLVGPAFNDCAFESVACFKSTTQYIQSLRVNNCVLNPVSTFVQAKVYYDMHIVGTTVESGSGILLVSTGQSGFVGCSIASTLIEGRSDVVISCEAASSLVVTNCYFESNEAGLITQTGASYACNIVVSGCTFLGTMGNATYMVNCSSSSRSIEVGLYDNVYSVSTAGTYISNIAMNQKSIYGMNTALTGALDYKGGFAPERNGKSIEARMTYQNATYNSDDSCWHFTASMPYGEAYSTIRPFLVFFAGSYGSNVTYQGYVVALVCPMTYLDSGAIKVGCDVTILASRNVNSASGTSTAGVTVTPSSTTFNATSIVFDFAISGFTSTRGRFKLVDSTNLLGLRYV